MNITDYIVTFLKAGHTVELPGIGSLASETVPAHYDTSQATMYPSRQETTFRNATTGDDSFVQYIAQQDCVSQATAKQMWKNYMDALLSKLQKEGKHSFEGLGTLTCQNGAYVFQAATPETLLHSYKPIAGVKRYDVANTDPFAQFEQGTATTQKPQHEPTPIVDTKPAHEEPSATAPIQEPIAKPEEVAFEEPSGPKPEPIQKNKPDTVSILTEPATILEEEETERAATKTESAPLASEPDTEPTRTEEVLKTLDEMPAPPTPHATSAKKTKKKGKGWAIILVLLLLCLIAAAVYYYLNYYRPAHTPETSTMTLNTEEMVSGSQGSDPNGTKPMDAGEQDLAAQSQGATSNFFKPNNDFTFSSGMLKFDDGDISRLSNESVDKLQGYIANYVKSRRSGKALEPMMQRVRTYAAQRLGELMDDGAFHLQEFFNYCANDYQHAYLEKDLRQHHAARQQTILQRDLMSPDLLGKLLDEVMRDNNLVADAGTAHAAAPQRNKQKGYDVPPASAQDNSKKGFDIIAGFYVNKGSADKLANTLKKKGCDAYIINQDGLYYVSMGSASSQTAAETLYHHIKEWYKGDVAIKKW
ncbi:MAG: SPOR domain-containing protein [Bacteroidales bacterium]|nr:SPOR domain-containing protein [Bacteroidales bacterium]